MDVLSYVTQIGAKTVSDARDALPDAFTFMCNAIQLVSQKLPEIYRSATLSVKWSCETIYISRYC